MIRAVDSKEIPQVKTLDHIRVCCDDGNPVIVFLDGLCE